MKGQISLDLLFTLVLVVIIIGAITLIGNGLKENYETINLQNQLRNSTETYAEFINESQTLAGFDFQAKLKLKEITFEGRKIGANINISGGEISSSYNEETYSTKYSSDGIIAEINEGYLVVNNE